ncbi:pyrroline-5-carboxylate reductase [Paraglaciecola aquimarina]|uniref:Pyrroline-5-carboxylate reductase n=1 Tax=Paraglaciecola aquimarina TaxID=1235557 RepID=A0ABU3SVW3_9ALTE|nr:pyrroline-5-carboxylate reductase [Paraglaciecola aquimarina]MDU0354163.1 pyrroline-5-carboxylate reductase [Paraglaciecola aquimarina]
MQQRKIAFIGAGNMTRSIISGLVANGYPAELIMASNPSIGKLEALHSDFAIQTTQDNNLALEFAEVVVLAVKPQLMEQVCAALAKHQPLAGKLFVSIAAGLPTARLQQMLQGHETIIRTMPNTPSALGKGMTGLFAEPMIQAADKQFAGDLMAQVGEIAWVDKESLIDSVIAAAGSSPAYFFLFLEAMQKEAEQQGFDHHTARLLVQQAMLGAAEMVCHNPQLELSALRTQVTSKGGTTAKAIESFQQQGLEKVVATAMQAAVKRAEEMANLF